MFNLCILQVGPINKNIVQDYPSYDKIFSSLFNKKIQFWNEYRWGCRTSGFSFTHSYYSKKKGDIDNPKGGIMGVIPDKQKY